jgi:hypothetical protein
MTPDQSTKSGVERGAEQPGAARDLGRLNLAVEQRAVDRLIPYARNARTHSPAQVAEIAASIAAFGWTNPIWWMARAGSSPATGACSRPGSWV